MRFVERRIIGSRSCVQTLERKPLVEEHRITRFVEQRIIGSSGCVQTERKPLVKDHRITHFAKHGTGGS